MDETNETASAAATIPATGAAQPRIVVGVDGSEQSERALVEAARLAAVLGARLEAVAAWSHPVSHTHHAALADVGADAIARESLEHTVDDAFGADRPELDAVVAQGHPAQVLIERSEGAELLVVGSRGRGGFTGLLLGSVSSECASNARCPVLIVR